MSIVYIVLFTDFQHLVVVMLFILIVKDSNLKSKRSGDWNHENIALLYVHSANSSLLLFIFTHIVCLFFQMHAKTLNIMRRAATLLQIFARHQFGCTDSDTFSRNSLKKTTKFHHYGYDILLNFLFIS